MFRNLIVEIFPFAIIGIISLYVTLKMFAMISAGVSANFMEVFLRSFLPYRREQIRNTFHEKLKKYFKISNKINTIFYIILLSFTGLYLFMRLI